MSSQSTESGRSARAEASAWLARLRSEERTAEDEKGFRAWLAEDERHRKEFDIATSIFEMAGAAQPARNQWLAQTQQRVSRRKVLGCGAGLVAASVAGIGIYLRAGSTYATEIGEQRKLALDDGTFVSLDTDTEIRVTLQETRRVVRLKRGRAHFDVADDPARPFEVIAGGKSVVANKANFDVTRDGVVVTVLAERGSLAIAPVEQERAQPVRHMQTGERVMFAADVVVREDRPQMSQAIAWRHGRLAFFGETLAQAVAEMNRYTRRPIVIADDELARMQISGNYSVGDTEAFATSVSMLLPARVQIDSEQVTLSLSERRKSAPAG